MLEDNVNNPGSYNFVTLGLGSCRKAFTGDLVATFWAGKDQYMLTSHFGAWGLSVKVQLKHKKDLTGLVGVAFSPF